MREHPLIGEKIVTSLGDLAHLAPAVRAEHERWDGRGYPDRLTAEESPLASRIVLAYDAMTSDRPYRRAVSPGKARAEVRTHATTQFDPHIAQALVED